MINQLQKIAIAIFVLIANTVASQNYLKKQSGPHNGQLEPMQNYMVELVLAYKRVAVYLYDAKLNPVANKNIKCEISLFYPDDINIKVRLKRFEENGFFSEVGGTGFRGCTVFFEINGKDISVTFQNEYVVQKEKKFVR